MQTELLSLSFCWDPKVTSKAMNPTPWAERLAKMEVTVPQNTTILKRVPIPILMFKNLNSNKLTDTKSP